MVSLHTLTRGMALDITLPDGREIRSAYDGLIDHMNFYVLCPEILKHIEELIDAQVQVKFFLGSSDYTFTAQILRKSLRTDALHETADFKILTAFKEAQRRENFRIDMQIKVKIHEYTADYTKFYTGELVCDAVSVDVNKNGIRLFADYMLSKEPEAMYTLEFELRPGWRYLIPAKLLRNERNTATRSYAFDCVFLFDFTNMPEKREKLFLDIMEAKLRGTVK